MRNLGNLSIVAVSIALSLAAGCGGKGSKGAQGPSGPVGSTPAVPTAPVITGISPEFASPAMQVTITGTDFGSAPEVLVGGAPASVVSASATSIVINPPSFAATNSDGLAPVVVHASGLESNPFPFRPGAPGDYDSLNLIGFAPYAGDIAVMGSGKYVISQGRLSTGYNGLPVMFDPATGKVSSNLAYGSSGLSQPIAMRALDANNVLLLDYGTYKLMKYNVTTGEVTVFRSFEGYYNVSDFVIDGTNIFISWGYGYVEKIDLVANTDDPYFAYPYTQNCRYNGSIEAVGGTLYVSTSYYDALNNGYPKGCSIDETTGAVTPLTFTGTTPGFISEFRADGANLAIAGSFGGSLAVADGVVTGSSVATTVVQNVPGDSFYPYVGVSPLGGGEYLVSTIGGIYDATAATLKQLGASPDYSTSSGAVSTSTGKLIVVSQPAFYAGVGWQISELDPATGEIRTIASRDNVNDTYGIFESDGTYLYVLGNVGGAPEIDQITIADGTTTPLVTGVPISSFTRDAAGNIYVVDGTMNVAQYDGQGVLSNATFATLPNAGAYYVMRHGTSLYFMAGSEIDTVTVAAGGAATRVATPDLVNGELISFDPAGTMLVIDNGTLYTVTTEGFFKPWLVGAFSVPRTLAVQADGRLLFADENYGFGLMLP